ATLYGECKVKDGRMVDLNFDSYQIMRLAEMPKVETVIVPSQDFWGGVGEPTISVVAPAVLNAIHAATGKPVRQLPLKTVRLVESGDAGRRIPGAKPRVFSSPTPRRVLPHATKRAPSDRTPPICRAD